jgi:excisionase family DNA binding protein
MPAGNRMTVEQVKKLSVVFRQVREVVKDAVDNLESIAENALMIFVEDGTDRKALPSSVAIEIGLLNKKQLAERLGVSVRTISELQNEGLPIVPFGKSVRFEYQEVLIWAKQRKIPKGRKSNLRVVR